MTKPSGSGGRVDVHVDAGENSVVVVEIKGSDWDALTPAAVKRNVRRQIRQIWTYIEPQLAEDKTVYPGVVFPNKPEDPECLVLIESLFDEEGIPVVWQDETKEERAERG